MRKTAVIAFMGLLGVIGPAAGGPAGAILPDPAEFTAYLSHETDLKHGSAVAGRTFGIDVSLGYYNAPADRTVLVRISNTNEPGNASLNASRSGASCKDTRAGKCDGVFRAHFDARFDKADATDRVIMVDGYIQSKDGRSIDKHLTEHIRIHVVPGPTLTIRKVDAPRPPDTVLVGEAFNLRLDFAAKGLVEGSRIKASVEAVSGGSGRWTWESGALRGDASISSDPITVKLNKAGTWKLRAAADTTYAEASPVTFQIQAVATPKGAIASASLAYPAAPETVQVGESVAFEATFLYRTLPAGTQVWGVLVDPATGKDYPDGWALSKPLEGSGSYTIRGLRITPTRAGALKVDVALRLPKPKGGPNDFDTVWKETAVLKVVEKTPGRPGSSDALSAKIVRIKTPPGTLQFKAPFPVSVLIEFDKLGSIGVVLEARIVEKGSGGVRSSRKSIVLKNSGQYAYPDFTLTANPIGQIPFEVQIVAPDGHLLHARTFTVTAVDTRRP